jgi:ribosome hibernation promoting factor
MKAHYTGSPGNLTVVQKKKLDARFGKLAKLLDRAGEKEAHVILTSERHLHNAEITVNYYDHPMVGIESDADAFTALNGAIDKLEKQILKTRGKWRDSKRGSSRNTIRQNLEEAPAETVEAEAPRRIHRVNHQKNGKPMTLDEAVLAMEDDRAYLVYRDAETDRVSVLLRRKDGHFDLIES